MDKVDLFYLDNIPYPPYNISISECANLGGRWEIYDINFENIH